MARTDPLWWSQWFLVILAAAFACLIPLFGIFLPTPLPALAPSPPVALAAGASADDIRAHATFYTDVTAEQRLNETFSRGFVVTSVLLPTLDMVLKTLAVVIALRAAPAVVAALKSGTSALER